ncbi:hypothetical protein [Vibrio salinus]|uniref:hypothetical protein n=1 Tax=Vibrio salinus TaxID=2899784 RepID=UPI001E61706A|nr:hypothetical protein [Vibrio salinus]MCE0492628.1 hypothetical protein [Vibrio salinus]
MANQFSGGWSPFHELSDEEKDVFIHGMEGFVGISYQPLVVATQVVAGCNYAFFCNAELESPGAAPYPAMVHMFRDLKGNVGITDIKSLAY